jgi:hypothetical protein
LGKTRRNLRIFQIDISFHWTQPLKAGLIDSESFKPYFHTIFKDATLADLKIPIHITATDMRGKLKYLIIKQNYRCYFSFFSISWNIISMKLMEKYTVTVGY